MFWVSCSCLGGVSVVSWWCCGVVSSWFLRNDFFLTKLARLSIPTGLCAGLVLFLARSFSFPLPFICLFVFPSFSFPLPFICLFLFRSFSFPLPFLSLFLFCSVSLQIPFVFLFIFCSYFSETVCSDRPTPLGC